MKKPDGPELEAMLMQFAETFFLFRRWGQQKGAVSASGGGTWGLMRLIRIKGPMTVPEIASLRGVSRQHIQTIVNDLAAEGYIELLENKAHKRSKLIALTTSGESYFMHMTEGLHKDLVAIFGDIEKSRISEFTDFLSILSKKLSENIAT